MPRPEFGECDRLTIARARELNGTRPLCFRFGQPNRDDEPALAAHRFPWPTALLPKYPWNCGGFFRRQRAREVRFFFLRCEQRAAVRTGN